MSNARSTAQDGRYCRITLRLPRDEPVYAEIIAYHDSIRSRDYRGEFLRSCLAAGYAFLHGGNAPRERPQSETSAERDNNNGGDAGAAKHQPPDRETGLAEQGDVAQAAQEAEGEEGNPVSSRSLTEPADSADIGISHQETDSRETQGQAEARSDVRTTIRNLTGRNHE